MKRIRACAAGAAATSLLAAGLLAAAPANAATTSKAAPAGTLKVMTVNLYLGASLGKAINAATTSGAFAFVSEAAKVYDTAYKTNFPLRAQWIAATIKRQNPDVLTLNELTEWVGTSTNGASMWSQDFLEILLAELEKQGMQFEVASVSPNADLGYSPTVGIPYINPGKGCPLDLENLPCQVRLKDRDAVLYNKASSALAFTGTADHGRFKAQETFTIADSTLSFDRGWASAAFTFNGKPVTVMTAHLEVESQDGKKKMKGKYGFKAWPSKIQVAQGKELLKVAQAKAGETEGRVILAGDFNSDANGYYSPTYRNLTKSYFKDSWKQSGGKFGKAKGATCCQTGNLKSKKRLDSGDPVIPTRIDVVLNRGAKAVWHQIEGKKLMQNKQPLWQSDHYFYAAAMRLN